MDIDIRVIGYDDTIVEKTDVLEQRRLSIEVTFDMDDSLDEIFEVEGYKVVTCISNDTNLNSAPTLCKVLNHIESQYGVEL